MGNKYFDDLSDEKLKVVSLQQIVYERIKKLILTNRLKPGKSLIIDQLTEELGVSHTPVREALAMLKLDGLVVTGYHHTPQVTDIEESDVREIYEVRMMLEGFAIQQVGGKLTPDDLDAMEKSLEIPDGINLDERLDLIAQSDVRFNGIIV